jgi:hypothetical protein
MRYILFYLIDITHGIISVMIHPVHGLFSGYQFNESQMCNRMDYVHSFLRYTVNTMESQVCYSGVINKCNEEKKFY